MHGPRPVLGVVHAPALGRLFAGRIGHGRVVGHRSQREPHLVSTLLVALPVRSRDRGDVGRQQGVGVGAQRRV